MPFASSFGRAVHVVVQLIVGGRVPVRRGARANGVFVSTPLILVSTVWTRNDAGMFLTWNTSSGSIGSPLAPTGGANEVATRTQLLDGVTNAMGSQLFSSWTPSNAGVTKHRTIAC